MKSNNYEVMLRNSAQVNEDCVNDVDILSKQGYQQKYKKQSLIQFQKQTNMDWDCSLILRTSIDQQTQTYQPISTRLKHANSSQMLANTHNKSINLRKEGHDKTKHDIKKKMSLKSKNNSRNKTSEYLKTQTQSSRYQCQNYSPVFCNGSGKENGERNLSQGLGYGRGDNQRVVSFRNLRDGDSGYGHRRVDTITFRATNSTISSNMSSNVSHTQYNIVQPQQRVTAFTTTRLYSPQFQNKIITIMPNDPNKQIPLIKINQCMPEQKSQNKISFKAFSNVIANKYEKNEKNDKNDRDDRKEIINRNDKKFRPSQKQNTQNTQNSFFNQTMEKSQNGSVCKNSKISTKLSCRNHSQSIIQTKNQENSYINFNTDDNTSQNKSLKPRAVNGKRKIQDFLKYQNQIRSVRDSDDLSEEYSQVVITFKELVENQRQYHNH